MLKIKENIENETCTFYDAQTISEYIILGKPLDSKLIPSELGLLKELDELLPKDFSGMSLTRIYQELDSVGFNITIPDYISRVIPERQAYNSNIKL